MTLHIENSKENARKLLELNGESGKVAGNKINAQKSLAFLHTNNERTEREIKETIPFTITTKRIKYLRINLPKKTKELYTENYKTLMKGTKADINIWRDIPCSWGGGINIVTMTTPKRNQHRFSAIPIKLSMAPLHRIRTKNSTIYMETQKTPNSQRNL